MAFMKLFEKMEKSEVGGKEVKRRKRSVEKGNSREATNSNESTDDKQLTDVVLSSPVADAKPFAVTTVEVKRDDTEPSTEDVTDTKQSVEKGSSRKTTNSSECKDETQVADVVLPSQVADTKPFEMTAVEKVKIKCDDTEPFTDGVTDTKGIVESCDVMDMVEGNDQSEIIDNVTIDLCEVRSPNGISESCLSPNESPSKGVVHSSPTDTELAEKTPHLECDAAKSDISAAIEDQPKTVTVKADQDKVEGPEKAPCIQLTVKADQDKVEGPEKAPCIQLSELGTDNAEVESIAAADKKPKPLTTQTMQTDVKAEIIDKVKKSDITSTVRFRDVKGGPKPLSTARLKFGMYSRKPLASRTWVKADMHESESSSDSDDSTTESETITKPKHHLVNFFCYFIR